MTNCLYKDGKYEKLLNPSSTSFAVEEELLDSTTKRELILAASSDLESFATQIKQIQSLEHVVESSDISGKLSNGKRHYFTLRLRADKP